jgi:hypothetical protein
MDALCDNADGYSRGDGWKPSGTEIGTSLAQLFTFTELLAQIKWAEGMNFNLSIPFL